ncbi:GGDEF domain-containing protein [Shewanella salipaludis]|uniref:diguanylate cyclase n=1 Tax=Shewanella salipaludis TaxID=2723052 RepID=A0A972FT93_9GAMM|nr:GGDEF domain-containing protein [Shewanella salipaludis]NMH64804.1 GGDEF domain-containing protein [Shewanella salipaludis]
MKGVVAGLCLLLLLPFAYGKVNLSEGNRLLPLASLYSPLNVGNAHALSLYLDSQATEAQFHSGPWQSLTITNTQQKTGLWYLTQADARQVSPLLVRSGDKLTPLAGKTFIWPMATHVYLLTLGPNETKQLLVQHDNSPTQLWSAAWWQDWQDTASACGYLLIGALSGLCLMHLALCLLQGGRCGDLLLLQALNITFLINNIWVADKHLSFFINLPLPLLAFSLVLLFNQAEPHLAKTMSERALLSVRLFLCACLALAITSLFFVNSTWYDAMLFILLFSIVSLTGLLLHGMKQHFQPHYLPLIGICLCLASMTVTQYQLTLVTERLYLYLPLLALNLLALTLTMLNSAPQRQARLSRDNMSPAEALSNNRLRYETLVQQLAELQINYKLLLEKNAIDFLTGLKNRQFFNEKYHRELTQSMREQQALSLIIIDIDFFKKVNDKYGHQTGDEVLQAVAKRFYAVLKRPADSICRYGGEEFAVLLPNTELQGAAHVAELIRKSVKSKPILTNQGEIHVTVSQGIASMVHSAETPTDKLLNSADKALYQAKNLGRDRIELAPTKPYIVTAGRQS